MASHYEAPIRRPLVTGEKSYHDVTLDVVAPVEGKANKQWWIVFSIALAAFGWGLGCMIYTISTGIGTWGLNKTVGWAWDITNFVWWVGWSNCLWVVTVTWTAIYRGRSRGIPIANRHTNPWLLELPMDRLSSL